VEENRRRGKEAREFELADTGLFDDGRYFDVVAEYAKASPDDVLVRITIANRGPEAAPIHVLPTLWFRNTWSWGRSREGYWAQPVIARDGESRLVAEHPTLGRYRLESDGSPQALFKENETNARRLYGEARGPHTKDAFHEYVIHRRADAINPAGHGTKAAFHHPLTVPAGEAVTLRLRLSAEADAPALAFDRGFDETFAERIAEADAFYAARFPKRLTPAESSVSRQAYAGLLWSKQF
jgi:hypothetical protein